MALEGYGWSGPCLTHLMPGKDLVFIIQEIDNLKSVGTDLFVPFLPCKCKADFHIMVN